ncbi:haloacid dehalogenase type II [Sediminitomix flava]|uniref:2-haloacid dehalogenase n=1 Tax=Sediminitomix flava TaxID=379075 RepID=A0A315Z663_SEDFL|nr:haloacid dehalogenase type II [Sediminitomix flava]PWJ39343.1 2-haloacid dehalogenase [Sediminitomix flava]
MKKSLSLAFFSVLFISFFTSNAQKSVSKEMENVKVIFLDVNETLLDLESMKASVSEALNGREDLMTLWFSKMLHYSLVSVSIDRYEDFGKIGVASLMMVAQNNGIELTEEQAKEAIIPPLLSLPAHPDVVDGLRKLKAKGYKLVTFTNSSYKGVATQLRNANLEDLIEKQLSTESVRSYKPFLETYQWALDSMNLQPNQVLMAAAHGWDVAGAKEAGMKTAFIARPGKALYPLVVKPDFVVKDFLELAEKMPSVGK